MSGGLGSRLGSAGLLAGVVVALVAGSSGVAAAQKDLGGGCTYYERGEKGFPTTCVGWNAEDMHLSNLDFTGANFSTAKFSWADLRGTNFTNANLSGVTARSPQVSHETKLSGATVDDKTFVQGLVEDQKVDAVSGTGAKPYFILGGVNPGLPSRFQPAALVQGITIDECTSQTAKTVRASVGGQQVDVKVLPPGAYPYGVRCTFTTGRPGGGKGTTSFNVKVDAIARARGTGPIETK